jgi:flagellin-like protein
MNKMLKTKKGISPILATLLLIVIAVAAIIVTYAWVMTFTTTTTGQAGAVLNIENVRFYNASGTLKVDITISNAGTSDAKVASVYNGTSSSNLASTSSVTYNPTNQVISTGSSITITISPFTWTTGTRYYFKVTTVAGQIVGPYSQVA